ncbi:phenazine biosynthesis protein PhzF family [Mitsuaria sp. PDC51]|jgi:PhzF family phenazine biosynthesis protein|uniref:PhzF family phenazine biosynthesis protein n=1 Tax=unclassified Roseateles TaxID=2626991 RepID=UPI0008E12B51|nr:MULTISPECIES: PhzF family phenazine biosynthesis protein [unclassified Roseateles]MBB3295536.1 PhzF family phenazine biosynthesis protein [Mitsuaria sp. BK041]MBB3364752.1 PhzF family phenazine biosynthesis protein [Mitsuaria sp. BK045]SFR92481.1 phenazine biosynthesis protein PhzF family [Mitsuaria sp. PDC51]
MSELRRFVQVDVFTAEALKGNPLAVVVDGAGLDEATMAAFARWTNLSETTFLLPPTDPGADYRVRIFTPGGELPFAGHPTLGSAHAWLASGGDPKQPGEVVQQCEIGLVRIRRDGGRLAFAAPPLKREGPVEPALREQALRALRLEAAELLDLVWVDNGPQWMAARLRSAEAVLALQPDFVAMDGLKLGVVGAYPAGSPQQFEVRAFVPGLGVPEDPVTGSLNAGLALWLQGAGLAPDRYVAAQGAALGRAGRIHVAREGAHCWIGGDVTPLIHGQVRL